MDTGAYESCIDAALAAELGLPVVDTNRIAGAGGESVHDVFLAHIQIPQLEVEEEEQAIELVSNESLAHQLRQMLEGGAREMVEGLPDGIHSGVVKPNARGVFFYFQARNGEERQHFWRYFDLKGRTIVDNRYLVANLIQCDPSTPRVVEPGALSGVFALQEEVIADILKSVAEQKALETAPRTIDPVQQTVATAIQGYLNHPDLDRKEAIELIHFLNQPMLSIQIRQLRAALRNFKTADAW